MRADAKRNRDRIVEVAREVFRERGYDASLDDIAKRAGVGPGTLYRHFPTREALLDAVMQVWVALISLHKGGPAKITSAMGVEDSPIATKTRVLLGATQRIVDHLRAQGALRDEVDALQLCRLAGGVAVVADQGGLPPEAVRPMLEILADGVLR